MENYPASHKIRLAEKEEEIRGLRAELQVKESAIVSLTTELSESEAKYYRLTSSFAWKIARLIQVLRRTLWSNVIHGVQANRSLRALRREQKKIPEATLRPPQSEEYKTVPKRQRQRERESVYPRPKILLTYNLSLSQDFEEFSREEAKLLAARELGVERYDLRNPAILRRQMAMASEAGIDGFCYYYDSATLNVNGNSAVEIHSSLPEHHLEFCLIWGRRSESEQRFEQERHNCLVQFIEFASLFFSDRRYVRSEGRPLVILDFDGDVEEILAIWAQSVRTCIIIWLKQQNQAVFVNPGQTTDCEGETRVSWISLDQPDFVENIFAALRDQIRKSLVVVDCWNDWQRDLVFEATKFIGARHQLADRMSIVRSKFESESKEVYFTESQYLPVLRKGYPSAEFCPIDDCFPLRHEPTVKSWRYLLKKYEMRKFNSAVLLTEVPTELRETLCLRGWDVLGNESLVKGVENVEISLSDLMVIVADSEGSTPATFTDGLLSIRVCPVSKVEITELDRVERVLWCREELLQRLQLGELRRAVSTLSSGDTLILDTDHRGSQLQVLRVDNSLGSRLDIENFLGSFINVIVEAKSFTKFLRLIDDSEADGVDKDWLVWSMLLEQGCIIAGARCLEDGPPQRSQYCLDFTRYLLNRHQRTQGVLKVWVASDSRSSANKHEGLWDRFLN